MVAETHVLGVVAYSSNLSTLKTEFWNGMGAMSDGGKRSSIAGWIMWPSLIQPEEILEPNWNLTTNRDSKSN